jgi:phosphatidylethanolamine-binding protein (PEBP) family uncharacterized protein
LECKTKPVVDGTEIGEVVEGRGDFSYQGQHHLTGGEYNGPSTPASAQHRYSIDLRLFGEHIGLRLSSRSHDNTDLLRFVESVERNGIGEIAIQQIFVYGR